MTGDSIVRERVILSARLIVPTSCCKDINKTAVSFRKSIAISSATERLYADISIKALDGTPLGGGVDKDNTDGKKRDMRGGSIPGMESLPTGERFMPDETWEEGKHLQLFPSYSSIHGLEEKPNFGWLADKEPKSSSFQDELNQIIKKPSVELTVYDVNPRTDDIVPESGRVVNPFSITSGLTVGEKRRETGNKLDPEVKILPGERIGSSIPGGNLASRAAAAFGVIKDELNKFRCPPGTPAANQFTDMYGTNCFGFSPSKFGRFAARMAQTATADGKLQGTRTTAQRFFDGVFNGNWSSQRYDPMADRVPGEIPSPSYLAKLGRTVWYDSITGERVDTPDWRSIEMPENQRWFKNGAIRAQDRMLQTDARVSSILDSLGVDRSETARATNEDLKQGFDALRALAASDPSLGWDIRLVHQRGGADGAMLTPVEVEQFCQARLQSVKGWRDLTKEEQDIVLKADVSRYYSTERAVLEGLLDQYVKSPTTMRRTNVMEYDNSSTDEMSTRYVGGKYIISLNMHNSMSGQESLLPSLRPNQRLSVAAVGASTDAEARATVADFLVNADHTARGMAGLIDGEKSYMRQQIFHEISHTLQYQAFMDHIEAELMAGGSIRIPEYDKKTGMFTGRYRTVTDFTQITSYDWPNIMIDVADDINIEALNGALSRIEVVSALAGSYPGDVYRKGGEHWALEVCAELWALREQGIIYGEDIDAALEWMDNVSMRAAAEDRAIVSSIIPSGDAGGDFIPDVSGDAVPDMPAEDMAEELISVGERTSEERRAALKSFSEAFKELPEEDMINNAALVAAQRDNASAKMDSIDDITSPAFDSAQKEFEFYDKMYEDAKKIWRKEHGVGSKTELARFEERVKEVRDAHGLYAPEEIEAASRAAALDDLKGLASSMSEKELVRKIADHSLLIKDIENSIASYVPADVETVPDGELTVVDIAALDKDLMDKAEELDLLRNQYAKSIKDAGDKRTTAQILMELDGKVETVLSPKPRASRKVASATEARDMGKKQRARLRRKITKEQSDAVKEMGTFDTDGLAGALEPSKQISVGRAANRKNARLKRLALPIDDKSSSEASFDDQIKNILVPTLEAMEVSSLGEQLDIETVMEFDPTIFTGVSIGREIENDGLLSGRVISKGQKKTVIDEATKINEETGKVKQRVVIVAKAKDRGIFPNIGDSGDQTVVMPPGKIRIVGREADGTIRIEIAEQKGTVEVLDSMATSIASGTDDAAWRKGASRKLKTFADNYAVTRHDSPLPGSRSDDADSVKETSRTVLSDVVDKGGVFGEAPTELPTYLESISKTSAERGGRPASEVARKLSSGHSDVFGPAMTREARTTQRNGRIKDRSVELRKVISGSGSGEHEALSISSLDSAVVKKLSTQSHEQIISDLETAAFQMHNGFDRRVRVRMREPDLEKFLADGTMRASSVGPQVSSGSRRVERLAGMDPAARAGRLSSGVSDSAEQVAERGKKEKAIAESALETFKKIADNGKDIETMSEEELSSFFGGTVRRSGQKSVSEKSSHLYEVDKVEDALALMMAGHHVMVKHEDVRLTEQAQKQFEELVKQEAANQIENEHPEWLKFKSEFEKINSDEDLKSPEMIAEAKRQYKEKHQADLCMLYNPENNLLCSGHIGIAREDMPQTNGRTTGHDSVAIRMLKDGKAAGKWAPLGNKGDAVKQNIEIEQRYVAEIEKENQKLIADGKSAMTPQQQTAFVYKTIGEKHNTENELTKKTVAEHRATFLALPEDEKQWLYDNTNWQDVEVNLEMPFIEFLKEQIKTEDGRDGVITKAADPTTYQPSQRQLVASKVDSTNEDITKDVFKQVKKLEDSGLVRGTPEFKKAYDEAMSKLWFMSPILATEDKYILDGHHRWAAIIVANRSLPKELQLPLNVNEVQTDIVEGLTLGKVFQGEWGIKAAKLGVEDKWKVGTIDSISDEDIVSKAKVLEKDAPGLVDEMYAGGSFIKLGSVGLSRNPDYAARLSERQSIAYDRRLLSEASAARETAYNAAVIEEARLGSAPKTVEEKINKLSSGLSDALTGRGRGKAPIAGWDEGDTFGAEVARRLDGTPEAKAVHDAYEVYEGGKSYEDMYGEPFNADKQLTRELDAVKKASKKRESIVQAMLQEGWEKDKNAKKSSPQPVRIENGDLSGRSKRRAVNGAVNSALKKSNINSSYRRPIRDAIWESHRSAIQTYHYELDQLANDISRHSAPELAEIAIRDLHRRGEITESEMLSTIKNIQPGTMSVEEKTKIANAYKDASDAFMRVATVSKDAEKLSPTSQRTAGKFGRINKQRGWTSGPIAAKFSSGASVGMANEKLSREYYSRIGIPPDVSNETMPVSGYLVHKSHVDEKIRRATAANKGNVSNDAIFEIGDKDIVGDGLTSLGDIEVVLKSGVSNRTSYGRGEAMNTSHRPVKLNSINKHDILDATINAEGKNNKNNNMDATLHLMGAGMDGNFAHVNAGLSDDGKMAPVKKLDTADRKRVPFEAQILGGFDKDEVEQINYPYSKIKEMSSNVDISDVVNTKTISEKLRASGFSQEEIDYFYSLGGAGKMNSQNMQMLREYRAAQGVKDKFNKLGFNNIRIAHPDGINIENPRIIAKNVSPSANMESILRNEIMFDIQEQAEKALKEMRKGGKPELITNLRRPR